MNGSAALEMKSRPEMIYDLVADVSRMGEWSPECYRREWLDGATEAEVGARFAGHNKSGVFRWSNVSQITRAERGRILSWTMGPGDDPYSAWQYTFEPTADGVVVTETFRSLRRTLLGRLSTVPLGGPRRSQARLQSGIQRTLERLRAAAEAQPGLP
ncbi:MAG TPA: SRPBCC family protein [Acidimicrobiales bacterium]|nr:SRPBCC family protein [Acidimicrobiales bacterium]